MMNTHFIPFKKRTSFSAIILFIVGISDGFAHHTADHAVTLHTNSQWSNCSMVIDPSLTQTELNDFNKDAASIYAAFSPLNSAQTLGKNRFDLSMTLVKTAPIKDYDGSWNNTFSHPTSDHWLVPDDHRLSLPAINGTMGVTQDADIGLMFTKDPTANYGFVGANVKYALIKEQEKEITVSGRLSYVSLFGPDDMNSNQGGVDVIVSKQYGYFKPYAAVSGLFTRTTETTDKVALNSANAFSALATLGTQFDWKYLTVSAEADIARVNTYIVKVGTQF